MGSIAPTRHHKIAILINEGSDGSIPMRDAFRRSLKRVSPFSQYEFFDPIHTKTFPNPEDFDLIVLSGGSVFVHDPVPWVLNMQDWVRSTIAAHPKQKILGMCWGHQIITVALGGTVKEMGFAEVGVHDVCLTEQGRTFLEKENVNIDMSPLIKPGRIQIHQFHKRDVGQPVQGFLPLATNNEAFVSPENTILTFQGHPEMNAEWASDAVKGFPAYVSLTGLSTEKVLEKCEAQHDGDAIWKRVLAWVDE